MAIAKLKLLEIEFPAEQYDSVLMKLINLDGFHPEYASKFADSVQGLSVLNRENPYADLIARMEEARDGYHLDLKCQIEILDYLNKWTKENNKIIVAVLHDLNLVQAFGEKVVMMNDGKIIGSGNPKDVLTEERLQEVYGIDVKGFMLEVLEKWR